MTMPGYKPRQSDEITENEVHRHYAWTYTDRQDQVHDLAIDLSLNHSRYEAERREERLPQKEWAHYASMDVHELDILAREFYQLFLTRSWSSLEQAGCVLSFIQSCINYQQEFTNQPF